jgi:hypothetical protein
MALIPLNTFKTKTSILTTISNTIVYTAPIGVTTIVLMAQVSNITNDIRYVNFSHYRNLPVLPDSQGNGAQDPNVTTELVAGYAINGNDASAVLVGKMIIESLDSIKASCDQAGSCKLILSILETANS